MTFKATAEITVNPEGDYVVKTVWVEPKVDRPYTSSTNTGGNKSLALRLQAAINAGVGYENPTIRTDNSGKTYVAASRKFLGRRLNADLKKLGY